MAREKDTIKPDVVLLATYWNSKHKKILLDRKQGVSALMALQGHIRLKADQYSAVVKVELLTLAKMGMKRLP